MLPFVSPASAAFRVAPAPAVAASACQVAPASVLTSYASGADQIDARDGNAEYVHCGPGSDAAHVDASDLVTGTLWGLGDVCENLDRSAAASAAGSGAGSTFSIVGVASDRAGRLVVRLSLPGAGAAKVTATGRIGHRTARVAHTRKTVRSAGPLRVTLRPTAAARRTLRRHRTLRVTVRVAYTPAGGKAQSARQTATLRARR